MACHLFDKEAIRLRAVSDSTNNTLQRKFNLGVVKPSIIKVNIEQEVSGPDDSTVIDRNILLDKILNF